MGRSLPYYALLVAVLIWCGAIVMPPLAATSNPLISSLGYRFFALICHQEDARSLHLLGYPLAVCARCTAIYFGFLFGIMLSPLFSPGVASIPRLAWAIAVVPMLVDVGADVFGIHASTPGTRIASGMFFGAAAALILTPYLIGMYRRNQPSVRNELKT
jgi:uncharacterized membrane protein